MPYQPEPARPHDLEPALALLERAQLPTNGVVERFGNFLVVRDMGRLVGLCGLEVHGVDGLLRSLVVDSEYRTEGIGTLLLEGTLALAAKMGLGSVYALTTSAREYLLSRGFSDVPRDEAPPGIKDSWEFRVGCPTTSSLLRIPTAPSR
jgi:amino-acid N-acetyltransferase